MASDPFEEFSRHLNRIVSDQPMYYPEAMVKLIDAIRDYIRSDLAIGMDLMREGTITREQFYESAKENEPLIEWLKKYEKFDIDPSLYGTIKEEH